MLSFLKKNFANIIFFAVFLIILVNRFPSWKKAYQLEDNLLPDISVQNLSGQSLTFPLQLKTPAVLIFWATWCGPCQVELARYQKAVEDKELSPDQIFLVSSHEQLNLVQDVVKKRKYPFQIFVDPTGEAAAKLAVSATPTVILVDKSSKIRWIGVGISPLGIQRAKRLFN